MKRRSIIFPVAAVALTSLLAAAALGNAAVVRPSLRVAVKGNGTVTIAPGGIACPTKCKSKFRSGANIHLAEHPAEGWQFAGWGGACSGSGACAVKLKASKSVRATFTMIPVTPPPDLTARVGHYSGTTSQGKPLTFDVPTGGKTVINFSTNVDVNCQEIQGFTVNEPLDFTGTTFTVKQPDLTVGDSEQQTLSDGSTVSLSFSG